MIGLLSAILCWIKLIGAMVLNALIDLVNLIVAGLGAGIVGLIAAWPISMPSLPAMPSGFIEAWRWVKWTPLPVDAGFAFLMFAVGVWVLWLAGAALLRWAKVVD